MKASLQLRMSQQLTLTPQLQQAIRLLQLSTQEMQQEVARMLDENPMLELAEEGGFNNFSGESGSSADAGNDSPAESRSDDDNRSAETIEWDTSVAGPRGDDDENDAYPEQAAQQASMREYLHSQLSMSQLDRKDRQVIGMLIDALDDNGYLAQDLDELVEILPTELAITLDDLETALVQLQYLDRPGIGARTLSECLALQLKALPEETEQRDLAICLVSQHLDLVAAHDFARIKKLLRCSDDNLRAAQSMIVGLNPKPGEEFDRSVADYVTPDVVVEKHKGKWRARLNSDAMPKLRVNQLYANILQQRDDKSGAPLVAQLQEASWLVKSLRQRFETIQRVAQAIVERHGGTIAATSNAGQGATFTVTLPLTQAPTGYLS